MRRSRSIDARPGRWALSVALSATGEPAERASERRARPGNHTAAILHPGVGAVALEGLDADAAVWHRQMVKRTTS